MTLGLRRLQPSPVPTARVLTSAAVHMLRQKGWSPLVHRPMQQQSPVPSPYHQLICPAPSPRSPDNLPSPHSIPPQSSTADEDSSCSTQHKCKSEELPSPQPKPAADDQPSPSPNSIPSSVIAQDFLTLSKSSDVPIAMVTPDGAVGLPLFSPDALAAQVLDSVSMNQFSQEEKQG